MSDLDGILVVALEQAVAAPYASNLLAEAGARVIKVERPEGDFARDYDRVVNGESAYFVWLNRGKESICLNLKVSEDKAFILKLLATADVFIQNLKPGAVEALGLGYGELSSRNTGLIMCSITGYGEAGEYADMKAYDLLVQAESGLSSITGTEHGEARVGVSICDIATGQTAYGAILRALIGRGKSAKGTHIETSLFGVMTDWMNVPLLHQAYGGKGPARVGVSHPSIAPYGAFPTRDGKQLLISIQNEREWKLLCEKGLDAPELFEDPKFSSNINRVKNRELLDAEVARRTSEFSQQELACRLKNAGIAYGHLNTLADVLQHPQLQKTTVQSPHGELTLVAHGVSFLGQSTAERSVPALGEHSEKLRREFSGSVKSIV